MGSYWRSTGAAGAAQGWVRPLAPGQLRVGCQGWLHVGWPGLRQVAWGPPAWPGRAEGGSPWGRSAGRFALVCQSFGAWQPQPWWRSAACHPGSTALLRCCRCSAFICARLGLASAVGAQRCSWLPARCLLGCCCQGHLAPRPGAEVFAACVACAPVALLPGYVALVFFLCFCFFVFLVLPMFSLMFWF